MSRIYPDNLGQTEKKNRYSYFPIYCRPIDEKPSQLICKLNIDESKYRNMMMMMMKLVSNKK